MRDKVGPLLSIHDFEADEMSDLATEIFKRINNGKDKDMYDQYLSVLMERGIMCPHPQQKRMYGSKHSAYSLTLYRWYDCNMCGCSVFNEDYIDDEKEKTKRIL